MTVYLVMHGLPYDTFPAEKVFRTREAAESYILESESEWAGYSEIIEAPLQ